MDPETVRQATEATNLAGKIITGIGGAILGFACAIWALASKINGYDSRLRALEVEQERVAKCIDRKLDRLHERIDEILLACGTPQARHIVRGHADDD